MIKHYLGVSKMQVLMNFTMFPPLAVGWFLLQGTASYILMAIVPFCLVYPLLLETRRFRHRLLGEEESTTTAP
jgi:hypothetical protein